MKNEKKLLSLILSVLAVSMLVTVSCKKENNEEKVDDKSQLKELHLKMIKRTSDWDNDSVCFQWSNDNKHVIKYTDNVSSHQITYNSSNKIEKVSEGYMFRRFYYNSQGLITKTITSNETTSQADSVVMKYTYSNNKVSQIEVIEFHYLSSHTSRYTITWQDDNILQIENETRNDNNPFTFISVESYEFDNKRNPQQGFYFINLENSITATDKIVLIYSKNNITKHSLVKYSYEYIYQNPKIVKGSNEQYTYYYFDE